MIRKNNKNSEVLFLSLLIAFICIEVIIIRHRVYAQNTPGCDCTKKVWCRQGDPIDSHLCKSGQNIPPCECKYGSSYYICPGLYYLKCEGTVPGNGCQGPRECRDDDCNPPCLTRPDSPCPNCMCQGCIVKHEINNGRCPTIYDPAIGNFVCTEGCRYI